MVHNLSIPGHFCLEFKRKKPNFAARKTATFVEKQRGIFTTGI
jgi:hypothetical protein